MPVADGAVLELRRRNSSPYPAYDGADGPGIGRMAAVTAANAIQTSWCMGARFLKFGKR